MVTACFPVPESFAKGPAIKTPQQFEKLKRAHLNSISASELSSMSPVAFINLLKGSGEAKCGVTIETTTDKPTIDARHWITKKDLVVLASKLDSKVPCKAIQPVFSSYIGTGTSTEGREAGYIILGYMRGEFPPPRTRMNEESSILPVAEIKAWIKANVKTSDARTELKKSKLGKRNVE